MRASKTSRVTVTLAAPNPVAARLAKLLKVKATITTQDGDRPVEVARLLEVGEQHQVVHEITVDLGPGFVDTTPPKYDGAGYLGKFNLGI